MTYLRSFYDLSTIYARSIYLSLYLFVYLSICLSSVSPPLPKLCEQVLLPIESSYSHKVVTGADVRPKPLRRSYENRPEGPNSCTKDSEFTGELTRTIFSFQSFCHTFSFSFLFFFFLKKSYWGEQKISSLFEEHR